VREDGLEVLARSRADLLKSISQNLDIQEEAGHYLLAVENILRSDIDYEATPEDELCLKAATNVLKQRLSPDELIEYLEGTERDQERVTSERETPSSMSRNISRLLPQYVSRHVWKDRMTGGHDIGMAHGKWPGAKPDSESDYSEHHPFHEDIHPLRAKNVVTGRPTYESMLFEKYFGHDNTPWWEDDFHEKMAEPSDEESFAKQAMRVEDAHEQHHRKLGSPIYDGVDKGDGQRIYSFFGGPKSNNAYSPYDHMETTRTHDYERWKKERATDFEALEKKFSGLSDEDKERAMQMQHFKDRMDKMSRGDTTTSTVSPTEGMTDQEISDFVTEYGPEAAEPYPMKHSHSMGWDTLMKGLYFLKPEDRTKVLQHIDENGSDESDHQLVKLSDGLEYPMTRLKKNLEMNAGAEKHWFTRSHAASAPNVPKTIESESDSKFKGTEGGMVNALRQVELSDDTTLYDSILGQLTSMLNQDEDDPDNIHEISNLFPHDEYHHRRIDALDETSDSIAEAFKKHAMNSNEAQLTRSGFLSLIGYDNDLKPLDKHPTLPSDLYSGPLIEDTDRIREALDKYDRNVSLGKQSKDIKNAYGFLRSGFNAPRVADLPDGHNDHYITMDGGLRGLSHLAHKYFGDRGGLGRDPATYGDFIHNHHKYDDGVGSLLGDVRTSILEPRRDTVGLYGGLHVAPLLPGQKSPMSALQILSRHGVSRRDVEGSEIARSSHNNYTDELSTHFPELMSSIHAKLPTAESHFQDVKFNRETSSDFKQNHPYSGIGGSERGDSSLLNRGAAGHRLAMALGRYNNPINPSQQFVHDYTSLHDNPELGPRPNLHSNYLQFLGDARKVIDDSGKISFGHEMDAIERRDILSEMFDIAQQLEAIESGMIAPERKDAAVRLLRGDLQSLRARDEKYRMDRLAYKGRDAARTEQSKDFSDKMGADMRASAEYAKSKLLPMILEQDPDAFNTANPITALANLMRLAHDASRGLMVDGDHDLETFGYHEKEATRDSLEQTMGQRGRVSPHKELATALRDNATELNPEMSVDEAMKALEMPDIDNDAHRSQVEEMLGKLVGPTKAATFGQILRMGQNIAGQDFSQFKDIDRPMREHIEDFEEHPYSRASIPLNRGVPEYGALNALTQLANPAFRSRGDLTTYGLDMHPHPLPPKKTGKKGSLWESSQKTKAYHQAMSNAIYTFDEQQSGPLEEASAGSVTKPLHGKMNVPIRPVSEMAGNVITPLFNSGRMDFGYSMSPSIGFEFGTRGQPMVGTNMPNEQLLNSVPMPWMSYVFGDEWTNSLYSDPNLSNMMSGLQSNHMEINSTTGMAPVDSLADLAKAELPKELPLIDPLHRIFEIEDMEQLRGFTGEWVISKYHDGQRVKIKRKGGRIDISDEDGEKVGVDDEMRAALRKVCQRDYVIDGTIVGDQLHINDIMLYDDTDVTDLTTRERVKLIRGQFDSHEPVHVPSPESIRVTDEVGFEEAVKDLGADGQKLLLRDAKSTYMKGEERHPKWVLLAKAEEDIHIPFAMEIDRGHFVIHLPEDLVKYEIVDDEPVNPIAAIGSIAKSDYSLRLANSLEPYWRQGFKELLKEELDRADWDENNANDGMTDERARRIEHQSGGLLKPKKDKNLLLKPKETLKALLTMERILDKLEKEHYPMSGGRALGIDVGSDIASPRGPTSLTSEHAVPDWDMKERPEEDPEKPSDYPKKPRKESKKEESYAEIEE
jgi:hypothetical protein